MKLFRSPSIAVLLATLCAGSPAWAQDGPVIPAFTDETAAAGINSTYEGQWEYMVGGGAAAGVVGAGPCVAVAPEEGGPQHRLR